MRLRGQRRGAGFAQAGAAASDQGGRPSSDKMGGAMPLVMRRLLFQ